MLSSIALSRSIRSRSENQDTCALGEDIGPAREGVINPQGRTGECLGNACRGDILTDIAGVQAGNDDAPNAFPAQRGYFGYTDGRALPQDERALADRVDRYAAKGFFNRSVAKKHYQAIA